MSAAKKEPGKGKKSCPECGEITGVRSAKCPKCSHVFVSNSKPKSKLGAVSYSELKAELAKRQESLAALKGIKPEAIKAIFAGIEQFGSEEELLSALADK